MPRPPSAQPLKTAAAPRSTSAPIPVDPDVLLSVAELCTATGLNRSTLRVYESRGLIHPVRRTPSGYRRFSADDVERIALIRGTQALGLSLKEIRELLSIVDHDGLSHDAIRRIAGARLAAIEARISGLQTLREFLRALHDDPTGVLDDPDCTVIVEYATRLARVAPADDTEPPT